MAERQAAVARIDKTMTLPETAPEKVGLDSKRLLRASRLVEEGREAGTYPAAVLLVSRHGKIAHMSAHGEIAPARAVTETTIFDLASLTKPIVALALLTLVEDGGASLYDSVADHLAEAKSSALGPITVRQLVTHTSGLPAWEPLYQTPGGSTAILEAIFRATLAHPPGTHYAYSDLGYILLGEIVHRASGVPLDEHLHSRIFAVLAMNDTGYRPGASRRERIAPTAHERSRPGQTLRGEVHDENAHALGGVAGHAGLFGTATDLAVLTSALMGNGQSGGHRLLCPPALDLVRKSQIAPEIGGHTIGWFAYPNAMLPRGDLFDQTTFAHTGFTGTMIVCNPTTGVVTILLTNRVMNPSDGAGMTSVRRKVLNAVASAVVG